MDLIMQIIQVCIIPLLGILTKYLVDFLSAKRDELKVKANNEIASKYLDMIYQTTADCVTATNQTFVESLKTEGKFDEEAQKKAFFMTLAAVMGILTDDAKEYIKEMTGDLDTYLTQLIESQVHKIKQKKGA